MTDKLGERIAALEEDIVQKRADITARRQARGYVPYASYLLPRISDVLGLEGSKLEFVDRAQFGADVAITIPSELRAGAADYIKNFVPTLVEKIRTHEKAPLWIESVESKGIYVNIRLKDAVMFSATISALETLGSEYGSSDTEKGKHVVLDYSHPNVAKHLHAGHTRSTIIGHILHNLYEATGYAAHGMNHINDWGGFGYLIEAYYRWGKGEEEKYENKNDFLYELYKQFRELEKEAEAQEGAPFIEFKEKSDEQFRKLEAGDPDTVALWERMVAWSLADFNRFYDLINIHLDYLVGESFYARRGATLVEDSLKKETAVLEDGAAVVHVGSDVDFVIRRSDESTIYATRDLAALEYRSHSMGASRMVYVVGQEQTDYFARLFKAADILGIVEAGTVLQHVPFGFYVNASTKKKLSSREGAQNVISLIESSVKYFSHKYPELSLEDAKKIAVGSITFNDIKKNRMMAVELDTSNVQKMIAGFEESGAAYVMYAVARARSIVRKSVGGVPPVAALGTNNLTLEPAEVALLKRIASLADTVRRAAEQNEPSVLAEYLLRLAQDYNSYYEQYPVLRDGVAEFPQRLVLTNAVAETLVNGLRLCHVDIPEKM